ncbi:hypothetical protein HZA97_04645 [Candidatus Woesearchaeota archaeon]|nr:hypothetical protein [Candidatus Woesearchaeota archaeon]
MSLKDVIEKAKINGYDLGRGIIQGTFVMPTFIVNLGRKNYSDRIYKLGLFMLPVSLVGTIYGVIVSVDPITGSDVMSYTQKVIAVTSFASLITNLSSLELEKEKYDKWEKEQNEQLEQTSNREAQSTKIDPWCELEEPKTETIDPWVKLESVIQNV